MIRALIVDDEAPARAKLRGQLSAAGDVEVVAEAADGRQAVELLRAGGVDVVFLDIQMPRLDGFGVVGEVGVAAMPLTVFVTAFDEHALRAFEVHALDYLLKPWAPSRLQRVLGRVRERLAGPQPAALAAQLARALAELGASRYAERVLVEKAPGREVLLPLAEVDLLRADGNYVCFVTAGGELRKRTTLSELEAKLDPGQFARINRSQIVRLAAVAELQPWFHGDYRVLLQDGTVLTWSRRYRARGGGLL